MKKIYSSIVIFFFILFSVNANELDQVLNKVYDESSKQAEGFISNLLSGPGDTEVSILGKNGSKPEASIMIVRPIHVNDDNLFFYQTQLSNYYISGQDRLGLNLGLGHRKLSDSGSSFFGQNIFIDSDDEGNLRASLGFEFRASNFEINGNYYAGLSQQQTSGTDSNRVLGGHDIIVQGQMPYLPWADIVYKSYEWKAVNNSKNSEGDIFKGEFNLTGSISLEAGVDDNNINLEDNFFRVTFVYPAKDRPTLVDNLIGDTAFEDSDVREEMLSKIKRSNQITVEVETTGVIITNGNS